MESTTEWEIGGGDKNSRPTALGLEISAPTPNFRHLFGTGRGHKSVLFYPPKFQAICIGKMAHDDITSFKIDSAEIKCEDNVTLLGINIDFIDVAI